MTRLLARWRVFLGFVFSAVVLWLATPTLRSLVIGGAIAIARRIDPRLGGGTSREEQRGHARRAPIATPGIRCTWDRR